MSETIPISVELSASIQRMKARVWRDADAQAYEQGAIPTKAAAKATRPLRASRIAPRQRPRSPDRQASRDRRRRLGGSSALPDTLRHYYTEGQRAVLCIIAGEIKHRGVCDAPIEKIAALAGVCRTTVQTTLHEARRLGHIKITERPMPGRKHLSNLVQITSPEWQTWLKRGPSAHRPIGSKSANLMSTTKSEERRKNGLCNDGAGGNAQPQHYRSGLLMPSTPPNTAARMGPPGSRLMRDDKALRFCRCGRFHN